jgi:hypothetical protein
VIAGEGDRTRILEQVPVRISVAGARPFARGVSGTLLLTADQLVILVGPPGESEVLLQQVRTDLAMARRPASRGGEQVDLAALDGQEVTLRFDREHVPAARALGRWLAGH